MGGSHRGQSPAPQYRAGVPAWPQGIVAIVPVFNHGSSVGGVVAGLGALGASVIAIDDGSTDDSAAAARSAGAQVITLERNTGKGAALRAGLRAASGCPTVISVDADGQHAASDALRLACAAAAEPGALHIGVRDLGAAPWSSRIGRRLSNTGVRLCCRAAPGDSQSGLRAYPTAAILALDIRAGRFAWEVEVLVRAVRAGIPLRQLPVACAYPRDRVSHFASLRDSLRLCGVVARLATGG